MGGNGSYTPTTGGVPVASRTHFDTHERIDGHKILIPKVHPWHAKTPMNSNSDNPIYLSTQQDKKTGKLTIKTIAIYENHKLVKTIDVENNGRSHEHKWTIDEDGNIGRKSHKSSNIFKVEKKYQALLEKVLQYNNK